MPPNNEGFYWVTSERASKRGVVQFYKGAFYLINEVGPITPGELFNRGWDVGDFIGGEDAR